MIIPKNRTFIRLRGLFILVAVAVGFSLALSIETPAYAELTPEMQTQVNQILAAGGPDVVANLTALAQANPDLAADIVSAGCAGGANCSSLATSVSAFTDEATDVVLQAIVQTYGGTTGGSTGGGSTGGGNTGGTSTSENPNQTSGSETDG